MIPGTDNSQRELISRINNAALPRLGRADVPESLERALSTAMAKSAASRYSSAHAFALALQRIQAELNLSVTPFEVLEEQQLEENHPDDGFEETRVRSIAAIDPERTGSAPTFPARTRPQRPGTGAPPSGFPAGGFPPAAAASAGPRPQVPGNLFAGQQDGQRDGGSQAGSNPAGEWAHATMLRGSAPAAAEYGSAPDATVQRPGLLPAQAGQQAGQQTGQQAGQQAGRSGAPGHRAGRADPEIDATISRPAPVTETAPEASPDHGKRNVWLAAAGGTLLVLAIIVGIVLASSAPAPKVEETGQASKPPADALDNGTVPDVADLAGTVDATGKATFTWTNPQPKSGDAYKWRVYALGSNGEYQSTAEPTAQVALNPTEPTCVQVMIVRSDGAFSPLEEDSIACIRK